MRFYDRGCGERGFDGAGCQTQCTKFFQIQRLVEIRLDRQEI